MSESVDPAPTQPTAVAPTDPYWYRALVGWPRPLTTLLLVLIFMGPIFRILDAVPGLMPQVHAVKFREFSLELNAALLPLAPADVRAVVPKVSVQDLRQLQSLQDIGATCSQASTAVSFRQRNLQLIQLRLVDTVRASDLDAECGRPVANAPAWVFGVKRTSLGMRTMSFLDALVASVLAAGDKPA